jgi:hypothetical protein
MKNLILVLILLVPFSLFAQSKVESASTTAGEQKDLWINKISSDSEMRVEMMNMMMVKTSGNNEEMMKLVNTILDNPEMNKMIVSENNVRTLTGGSPIETEARGMMGDSVKTKEMMKLRPVPRK